MKPIPDDHPDVLKYEKMYAALYRTITHAFCESLKIYESKPDDPFARRLLVRAVIGYIEALLSGY